MSRSMTKRHFELIADVLRIHGENYPQDNPVIDRLAVDFANELALTNPLFDRNKFLSAAGAFQHAYE